MRLRALVPRPFQNLRNKRAGGAEVCRLQFEQRGREVHETRLRGLDDDAQRADDCKAALTGCETSVLVVDQEERLCTQLNRESDGLSLTLIDIAEAEFSGTTTS